MFLRGIQAILSTDRQVRRADQFIREGKYKMRRKLVLVILLFVLCAACSFALADGYPETAHPYKPNADLKWTYTHPTAADGLRVTLSADSIFSDWADDLYLLTSNGGSFQIDRDDLGGWSFIVQGNTFTMRLVSGENSDALYGFKVTGVEALTQAQIDQSIFTVDAGVITEFHDYFGSTLTVPQTVNGQTITAIGEDAFYDVKGIAKITLPESVTRIEEGAFRYCTDLRSINLPNNLVYLGDRAFQCCENLQAITVPNGITVLNGYTFDRCGLKSVTLPSGLREIGAVDFSGCKQLTKITIPSTVSVIGENAFAGSGLTSCALPSGVTEVPCCAFDNCLSLKKITLGSNVTVIDSSAFSGCTSLTGITLPQTLTSIGGNAFADCESLTEIAIPASITSLSGGVFSGCTALKTITFGAGEISLDDYDFSGCPMLRSIDTPIVRLGYETFYGCHMLRSITLSDKMPEDESYHTASLANLYNIVVTVGKNSPLLPHLKEDNVCYRVRETGETNVDSLPEDTIAGKLRAIGRELGLNDSMSDYQKALLLHDWVVDHCSYELNYMYNSAWNLLLSDSHSGICEAFTDTYRVMMDFVGIPNKSIHISGIHAWNLIKLDDGKWYHVDCTWDNTGSPTLHYYFGLSNLAVSRIEDHGPYEIDDCDGYKYNWRYQQGYLDSAINEGYTAIQNGLNAGDATVNVQLTSLRWYGDTATVSLVLNDKKFTVNGKKVKVKIVPDGAYGLVATTARSGMEMLLPAALTVIDAEAFYGIEASSVALGESVTSIGARAFANCKKLKKIYIPASVTSIDTTAFDGVKGLTVYGIPGSYAESWAKGKGFTFEGV